MTTEEMLYALGRCSDPRAHHFMRDVRGNVYQVIEGGWRQIESSVAREMVQRGDITRVVADMYRKYVIANRIDDRRFKRELKRAMLPNVYKENIEKDTLYYIYKEQAETMRSKGIHNYIVYAHQTKSGVDEYIHMSKFFGEYEHKYEEV